MRSPQFNLVQNQFSAEFGGASGGVFNAIVKTGTNQIHGSIYEYMQNRDLNAVDATETQRDLLQSALRQQPPRRHHRRPHHQGQAVLLRKLRVQPARPGRAAGPDRGRAHRRRHLRCSMA